MPLILSFDTGYSIGFSIVNTETKTLLNYGIYTIPPKQTIEDFCVLTYEFINILHFKINIDKVFIEVPVFYDTLKSRISAMKGDLFFVHASAITIFNTFQHRNKFLIEPSQWKGQMSKRATKTRVRAILGNHQVKNIKSEHIFDSIGIGLSQDQTLWSLMK